MARDFPAAVDGCASFDRKAARRQRPARSTICQVFVRFEGMTRKISLIGLRRNTLMLREHRRSYLTSERFVPRLAATANADFKELQSRKGACVTSQWHSFNAWKKRDLGNAVGGGVTVTFPRASRLSQSHLAPIAQTKIRRQGHMWVCVPPFRVVDITLPIPGMECSQEAIFEGFVIQRIKHWLRRPTVYKSSTSILIASTLPNSLDGYVCRR